MTEARNTARTAGDALAVAVVAVTGLGLVRSFTAPAILAYGGRTVAVASWVAVAIGIVIATVSWPLANGPVRKGLRKLAGARGPLARLADWARQGTRCAGIRVVAVAGGRSAVPDRGHVPGVRAAVGHALARRPRHHGDRHRDPGGDPGRAGLPGPDPAAAAAVPDDPAERHARHHADRWSSGSSAGSSIPDQRCTTSAVRLPLSRATRPDQPAGGSAVMAGQPGHHPVPCLPRAARRAPDGRCGWSRSSWWRPLAAGSAPPGGPSTPWPTSPPRGAGAHDVFAVSSVSGGSLGMAVLDSAPSLQDAGRYCQHRRTRRAGRRHRRPAAPRPDRRLHRTGPCGRADATGPAVQRPRRPDRERLAAPRTSIWSSRSRSASRRSRGGSCSTRPTPTPAAGPSSPTGPLWLPQVASRTRPGP